MRNWMIFIRTKEKQLTDIIVKILSMKIKFLFAWYDFWIGLFWDSKKKWLYILPIPCFGIILKFKN